MEYDLIIRNGAVATTDGSFEAELPVDEDGLVVDYPSLFERIR